MQVRIRLGLLLTLIGGCGFSRFDLHHGGLNLLFTVSAAVGIALIIISATDIVTSR